jgi:hypothetical protein
LLQYYPSTHRTSPVAGWFITPINYSYHRP